VIVSDEKNPPASTLSTVNEFESNNEIDNDDSPVAKTSDLTNTPISEGTYLNNTWLFKHLSISTCSLQVLAYFKLSFQNTI